MPFFMKNNVLIAFLIFSFLQITTAFSQNIDSLRLHAIALLYEGNYDEALSLYNELIPQFYAKQDYYQYIKCYTGIFFVYYYQEKYDEIIELATLRAKEAKKYITNQDSTFAEMHYYLGLAYASKDDYYTAYKHYKINNELIRKYERNEALMYSYEALGLMCYKRGDFTNALNYYQKSFEICQFLKLPSRS